MEYSVSDIFCCGYALYFWEGIKLRHPEYCCRQKSLDEIFEEMGGTAPPYRRQGVTKKYTACIPKRREVIPGADIHIQRLLRRILTEISIMVTALYNAPSTMNHYYQQEVRHDMYGGEWEKEEIA